MKNKSLSIIVPVFNEEKRIMNFLHEMEVFPLKNYFASVELIIVDDGSKDATTKLIQNFNSSHSIKIDSYNKNMGKGYALRRGVALAVKDYCLLTDVDLSVPLEELEKFIPFMGLNRPLIIGSRKTEGAQIVRPQAWHRQRMGEVYTRLANLILGMKISDFTCGFKVIESQTAKRLFSLSRIKSWSYDPEILFLASKFKIPILEIPVRWQNSPTTKVNLSRDIFQELMNLIFIRFRSL